VRIYKNLISRFLPVLALLLAPLAAMAGDTPVPEKGDTAWLMQSPVLVILMTIPGLALFYGGMVRSKNVLSVLMQVFVTFCLIALLWAIYGYSLAFTTGNAFFGGLDRLFMAGLTIESVAATFSKGVYVPELVFFIFQGAFSGAWLALVGWFVLSAATAELSYLAAHQALSNFRVRDLMTHDPVSVRPDMTIGQLIDEVISLGRYPTAPVV